MYVPPRPQREDDPWFAVRLGLVVVAGFIAMAVLRPTVGTLCAVLPIGLIAGQRKAFNPVRALVGPIAFGLVVWVMAAIVALTRPVPGVLLVVMGVLFFVAFYLTRRTGSPVGMLILIAGAMMSVAGMKAPGLLNVFRDGFLLGCLVSLVTIPVLYLLIPAATAERLVEVRRPAPGHHGAGSLIRAGVLLGLCLWLYAVLPASDIILAIAAVFPLIFPTRDEAFAEAAERSLATIYGAAAALAVLAALSLSAHFAVLLCLVFLVSFLFGEAMIDGRHSASVYQFALSGAMGLVATALTTGSPGPAIVGRIILTLAGSLGAALLVALLDRAFLGPVRHADDFSPHPAIQRRRLGRELT